ncbi:2Fe-2S iron-sulfur cluster-binding protein [Streptomyces sp. NBC_01210]|uniref:2Fe-2S iron-sulfur cluster-binding protein n=1 Tax=Streptomyces sp. NBC_01210 TaxID=2903774 RepID=UPI002E1145A1|nr:2Fe-2S iron-sulfur cluster-binding protein [Streptomyces sp. NBC_01210]
MTGAAAGDRAGPSRTAGPAPVWYKLKVVTVERLAHDAAAITLTVPDTLAGIFTPRAGQHLVIRHSLGAKELRRTYSICPPPGGPSELRLVVKRRGVGGFAEYATTRLATGDVLEVGPPAGGFRLADQVGAHHVMVAGGTGITPLLTMAASALRNDPQCRVSLIYANQTSRSILLADDLGELKDTYFNRFFHLHVLSQEARESELLSGRIDSARLPKLLALLGADPAGGHFYLCGPSGLVETVREGLARWGVDPSRVRCELFTTDQGTQNHFVPVQHGRPSSVTVTARIGGRIIVATMEPGDRVVLDALLRALPDTPYSCREGLCGSCRAKVISGVVSMRRQYALGETELAARYTLACQGRPASNNIDLDFDA